LFVVCPVLDISLQTMAVGAFASVHALFVLWVFLHGEKGPSPRITDLAITLFAVQILGIAGFLGIAVFPTEASFLFPLCLVLMPQIYIRRPVFTELEVILSSIVYLVFCGILKSPEVFFLDIMSVVIAVGIAFASTISNISYKIRTFRLEMALQQMCELDPMTQVNNKPTFSYLVSKILHDSRADGQALAMCDLDDFKSVNDRHGHCVGDAVLKAFSEQLHRLADGNADIIAGRFGGDEFVLFFTRSDSEEQVLKALGTLCSIPGFDFPVTCSIGVAFSKKRATLQQYFEAADHIMYMAKTSKTERIITTHIDI
jgi:diguanylate cyclase (GGDEF)-like protein